MFLRFSPLSALEDVGKTEVPVVLLIAVNPSAAQSLNSLQSHVSGNFLTVPSGQLGGLPTIPFQEKARLFL
jgi:hypothetical protein